MRTYYNRFVCLIVYQQERKERWTCEIDKYNSALRFKIAKQPK